MSIVARRFLVGRGAFDETYSDPAYVDLAQVTGLDADGASFEKLQSLIEESKRGGGWVVLFGHEVGEAAKQTVPFETLSRLCEWLSSGSAGVWCDTVFAVGDYVASRRRGRRGGLR